jgi:hypothetical protein
MRQLKVIQVQMSVSLAQMQKLHFYRTAAETIEAVVA